MKIFDLDFISNSYHHFAFIRSHYLDCAKKCTKDFRFSLNVDGRFLCDLTSIDDVWFVPLSVENILFELVFEADESLRCFCKDHDIEYEPITDECYLAWFSSKNQSK